MRLTSYAVAAAHRVVIALSLLHAVFGMSLVLRDSGSPIGIVHASMGHAPGWMLVVDLRPRNTHAWAYHHIPPTIYDPPDAVQLNIWTIDLIHASFVQYVTLDRALDLLVAGHMSVALTLLVLALMSRRRWQSIRP